jgi:hypothetical protein
MDTDHPLFPDSDQIPQRSEMTRWPCADLDNAAKTDAKRTSASSRRVDNPLNRAGTQITSSTISLQLSHVQ